MYTKIVKRENVVKKLLLLFFCMTYAVLNSFHQVSKSRIFDVMYQGYGGMYAVNKQVSFADVKNISQDLNLKEIAKRFDCKTLLGQNFILFNLEKPISPFDQSLTIENRQKLIRLLVESPELLDKFELLISQAIEHEAAVIKFMAKRSVDSPTDNPLSQFFRWMDKEPRLSTYFKYMQLNSFLRAQIPAVVQDGQKAWNSIVADIPLSSRIFMTFAALTGWSSQEMTAEHRFTAGFVSTLYAGFSLYSHYTGALATRDALYSLHKLIAISKQIEMLCKENKIDHQFKVSSIRSDDGVRLLATLDGYDNKDTHFIVSTLVNACMYDVYEYDEHLAPVYACIGEIDAYVAIAKKMIDLQSADHQFCFAQFLELTNPKIKAIDFWNMLVTNDKVVVNNLTESKNIILTGANEGGKTTMIRAILQNIVLAQTFGIAAAKEFVYGPYTKIHSYLNVCDDILAGKSRYAFELLQAKNILRQIQTLKPKETYFFVLDELFTGTNGPDGEQTAYNFIDNIASYHGIQFIYATHFNRLKEIGLKNPQCVNYKIDPPLMDADGHFVRDEQGDLIYPYTLSLGANTVNVALERAKDMGIFSKEIK